MSARSPVSIQPAIAPPQRANSRLGVVVLLVLLCVGGGFFFRYNLRDELFPRNFGTVEAGHLYRSGRQTPAMLEKLVRENHIKTLVDLGAYAEGSIDERLSQQTAQALGLNRFVFRLEGDGTGDPNMYVAALKVLADPANHPVLVHCATGAQRTSGCVVLYRHVLQGKKVDEVFPESFAYKHNPRRNPYLRPYLDEWTDKIEHSFKTGEHIDYTPPSQHRDVSDLLKDP